MYCADHSVRTRTCPAGDRAEQRGLAREKPARTQCLFILTKAFRPMWSFLSVPFQFSRSVSHVPLFATPWTAAHQASHHQSITNSQSLLTLTSIESVMTSNPLILCCPLLLLASISPSIRVFSNESALHIRWPNYWSCSFLPMTDYSGLISFRVDWLDLLEVQGTLKSLLQHHSSKASILRHSTFFVVQLSHPYMTTAKTSFD